MNNVKFRFVNRIKKTRKIEFVYTSINDLEMEDSWQGNVNYERLAINLFTGLSDRQGKEIYEGDIVRDTRSDETLDVVEWSGQGFALREYDEVDDIFYCPKEWEVIGNIYEHKNLLEGL